MLFGASVIVGSGIYTIWRERALKSSLRRKAAMTAGA